MHVYPHEQLALLPSILLPVVSDFSIDVGGRAEPIARFTEMCFCASLSSQERAQAAHSISAIVQKVCYGRVRRPSWSEKCVDVPSHLRLGDLILTDRALVSLQRHEFFRNDGPWRSCTVNQLMGERGAHRFGSRLLLAFLLAAQAASTVATQGMPDQQSMTLEHEIEQLVRTRIHSPRTASVYLDMHGWGGRGRLGLAQIAVDVGLTHERVRQIGVAGEAAMADLVQARDALPTVVKALELLGSMAPCLENVATEVLRARGLTQGDFASSDLLSAAARFGIRHGLCIAKLDSQEFVARDCDVRAMAECRHIVRRALRSNGILEVDSIRSEALRVIAELPLREGEMGRKIRGRTEAERLVDVAISTMAGWSYLDHDRQWATVVLGSDGEELHPRGPVARIARMAVYFGGVRLAHATKVLAHHGIEWPPQILLALCLRTGLKLSPLADDWLIEAHGNVAQRVARALSATTELVIAQLLKNNGGTMERALLVTACERAQIHRSTVMACLKTASLYLCHDDGQCELSAPFLAPGEDFS